MAPMKAMKAMKAGGKPMTKGSLAEASAGETELKRSECMKVFESIDTDHDSTVNAKFADLKRRRAEFASIGARRLSGPRWPGTTSTMANTTSTPMSRWTIARMLYLRVLAAVRPTGSR